MSAAGRVLAVRGNVGDVRFPLQLPQRRHALYAGKDGDIVLEVESHTAPDIVRCIALTRTRGLARGAPVVASTAGRAPPASPGCDHR